MSRTYKEKRVAVILTEYRHNSHADVILSRLFGDFGYQPVIKVASLYTDQVPSNDMSREKAKKHGVPILPTIAEAIAVDDDQHPIDGVIIIGEHGDYPWNDKHQKMYPRRRFMEETLLALDRLQLTVPVFSDKHLSYNLDDTVWIYNQIKKRNIPFYGGSSIPLTKTEPAIEIAEDIDEVFVVSWLGVESYGFHGMEVLQAVAEKRSGGETGVTSILALEGNQVWEAMDQGIWPEDLLLEALATLPDQPDVHPRDTVKNPTIFIIDYLDGTKGYVIQLEEFVGDWSFAYRQKNGKVEAARHLAGKERPFTHFGLLTKNIEEMMVSGVSPIPIERTFITSGLINLGMESLYQGMRMPTPELQVNYNN